VSVDSTCEAKARAWVADYARHEVFPHHPLHGALALALAVELGSMKATIIAAVAAIYGEHASGPVAIPLRGVPPRLLAVLLTPVIGVFGGFARQMVRIQAIEHIGAAVISHFERQSPGKRYVGDAVSRANSIPQAGEPA
jgi:hypothetical protein